MILKQVQLCVSNARNECYVLSKISLYRVYSDGSHTSIQYKKSYISIYTDPQENIFIKKTEQ